MKTFVISLILILNLSLASYAQDVGILYDSTLKNITESEFDIYFEDTQKKTEEIKQIVKQDTVSQDSLNNSIEGTWIFKKKTLRRSDITLIVPVRRTVCNARIPDEANGFEKKVILRKEGKDHFVIRPIEPISIHKYHNSKYKDDITYENFGFKAVLDPENLTFAYNMKNLDYLEKQNRARQVWYNGKIFYQEITPFVIKGRGYEIVQTPECMGFFKDEIEFELIRTDIGDMGKDKKDTALSRAGKEETNKMFDELANQKDDFNPVYGDGFGDLGDIDSSKFNKYFPKDSAISKKPFDFNKNYSTEEGSGKETAGMW